MWVDQTMKRERNSNQHTLCEMFLDPLSNPCEKIFAKERQEKAG